MPKTKESHIDRSVRNAVIHAKTLDDYLLEALMVMDQLKEEDWHYSLYNFSDAVVSTREQLSDLLLYANSLIDVSELVGGSVDANEGGF